MTSIVGNGCLKTKNRLYPIFILLVDFRHLEVPQDHLALVEGSRITNEAVTRSVWMKDVTISGWLGGGRCISSGRLLGTGRAF